MTKFQIQSEARLRQGTELDSGGRRYQFLGTPSKVEFRQGGEGLVQPVVDVDSGKYFRIKCFFDPSPKRKQRSEVLVQQKLAKVDKNFADALGGAPFEIIHNVGPTTPFAVVMKEIQGESWDKVKEKAREEPYPAASLPPLRERATWAYGLATAVKQMEANGFIHADIAHGNIMVVCHGPLAGSMALVDFDAFVHPQYPHLENSCLGTAGYAAPEVNLNDAPRLRIGTDRIGMAILIQEFLLYGDADLADPDQFLLGYDQEGDLNQGRPEAHPLFEKKYPALADLLKRTLSAALPERRPSPEEWREPLHALAGGKSQTRPALRQVRLEGFPVPKPELAMDFPDLNRLLDLSLTNYGMRLKLERDALGWVDAVVPADAKVRFKNAKGLWEDAAGRRIPVTPGLVMIETGTKSGIVIHGVEQGAGKAMAAGA